jgi:hypothetical protein
MMGSRLHSSSCAAVRELFAPYLDEALARPERSTVREHLAACTACRREASAFDPAFLFAAMPAESVSAAEAAEILAGVRAGIALKSAEKRIQAVAREDAPNRRTAATAAAVAAVVLLMWTSPRTAPVPQGSARRADAGANAGASPNANPIASPVESPAFRPAAVDERPALPFASVVSPGQGGAAPAKGNLPADATIYDWNPGGGQPRVVWIVDRSLDI